MSSTAKWLPTSIDRPSRRKRHQPPTSPPQKNIGSARITNYKTFKVALGNCSICSILATPPHEWHSQPLESTRHAGNYFVPLSIRPIIIFFVAEVLSNYLTTDGLKKIFSTSGGPQRPEARGICHVCHMVNPALLSCRVRRAV